MTTDARYDVITSEPPPPNNAGVVNLYSREYYRAAKQVLKKEGVLAQWLPVFQLSGPDIEDIVSAFVAEFPYTALFYAHTYQWILVGSQRPLGIDPLAWEERANRQAIAESLRHSGIDGWADMAGSFMQSDAGLRALAATTPPLSDIRPTIQYSRRSLASPPELVEGLVGSPKEVIGLLRGEASPELMRAKLGQIRPHVTATEGLLENLHLRYLGDKALMELVLGTNLRAAMAPLPKRVDHLDLLGLDVDRAAAVQRAFAQGRSGPFVRFFLARSAFYHSDYQQALEHLQAWPPEELQKIGVSAASYWLLRGGCERALGLLDAAGESLDNAMLADDNEDFRRRLRRLRNQLHEPWPAAAGPLSAAEVAVAP